MKEAVIVELLKLSPAERNQLAEDLWDSVAARPDLLPALSDDQRQEIERRVTEHARDPGSALSWEDVRALVVASGMTRRIVFRPEAETDLAEAVDWYEIRGQGLGAEFLRSLDAVIAHVQRHPTLYPIVFDSARCCGDFPTV